MIRESSCAQLEGMLTSTVEQLECTLACPQVHTIAWALPESMRLVALHNIKDEYKYPGEGSRTPLARSHDGEHSMRLQSQTACTRRV